MQKTQQQLKQELSQEIQRLREKLEQLVANKEGQFLDPEVVDFSQEIDELIVKYQKAFEKL